MLSAKHLPRRRKNEQIELFLKRHWFIFFIKILFHLVLIFAPLIFYFLVGNRLYDQYFDNNIRQAFLILIISVYYLSIWLFFASSFINDFLDYWIVTNHRIININQLGLFARSVGELKLVRIQDVASDVRGFFPTILHYGNVYVQSAGTRQRFIFKQVPHADRVAQDIWHLVEKYKYEHREEMMFN